MEKCNEQNFRVLLGVAKLAGSFLSTNIVVGRKQTENSQKSTAPGALSSNTLTRSDFNATQSHLIRLIPPSRACTRSISRLTFIMDKYRKVERKNDADDASPRDKSQVRITQQANIKKIMSYASKLLKDVS